MLATAESISKRIHVDVCDGQFAENKTVGMAHVYSSEKTEVDLHLMLKDPASELETALSLKPALIIFHAESDGNLERMIDQVRTFGIKAGLAVLSTTSIESARQLLGKVDHLLVFTGTLGQNGGEFQADQLSRAQEARAINPGLEVSVDGGVSGSNAALIVREGVDVLYSGGFLQNSPDPKAAYESIMAAAGAAA